jgi:hypothetical protein
MDCCVVLLSLCIVIFCLSIAYCGVIVDGLLDVNMLLYGLYRFLHMYTVIVWVM